VARRSESIALAEDARVIFSRRDSRVSIPSRAVRMSDWRSCSERASRRRFSDNEDNGTRGVVLEGDLAFLEGKLRGRGEKGGLGGDVRGPWGDNGGVFGDD
jgi:hypothetical protein